MPPGADHAPATLLLREHKTAGGGVATGGAAAAAAAGRAISKLVQGVLLLCSLLRALPAVADALRPAACALLAGVRGACDSEALAKLRDEVCCPCCWL